MVNKYELVKFVDEGFELEVNVSPKEETIWLSLDEMSSLFERDRSVIGKHIKKIYIEKELDESRTRAKNARHLNDGRLFQIDVYNLDVIIAVGYRVSSKRGTIFRQWANNVLKEYLLKGYVINEERSLVTNENYVRLINKVESLDERLSNMEKELKPQEFKNSKLFFDGQFYDAYTLIQSIFESANNEIIIIDNYVDRSILDRLVVKKTNIQVTIYTTINSRLLARDINTFNSQYGGLNVKYTTNVHDRYIIIDQNKLYHLGHSIKDLGKKIFSISESDRDLIVSLLKNI